MTDKSVTFTVDSPSPGQASIGFTLNRTQVGVVVTGVDEDCITFTDEIAKNGLKATLQNVPYPTIDIH